MSTPKSDFAELPAGQAGPAPNSRPQTPSVGGADAGLVQAPIENSSVFHEAAGNLAFLLSVVRCGEALSEAEELNVRRVIQRLRDAEEKVHSAIRLLSPAEIGL